MIRCAIVGHSGSGKTTLIERLIPLAQARGLSVSTVKHTHHRDIELDTPGKDSYRHRVAGAAEVIVASDHGWARIAAAREPATLERLLQELRPVDLVIVEGFKQLAGLRRVEVFRGGGNPLAKDDPGIDAVAVPAGVVLPELGRPLLPLDEPAAVLDFILSR